MESPGVAKAPNSNSRSSTNAGGNSKPASCGAVALLEKYSALNSGIDEARRQTAASHSRLESVNSQIEARRSERNAMAVKKKEAEADAAELGAKVKESRRRAEATAQARKDAARDRDAAKEEVEKTRMRVENEREAFLQERREFRLKCKRIRLEATALSTKSCIKASSSSAGKQGGRNENGREMLAENIFDVCVSSSSEEEESDDEDCFPGALDSTGECFGHDINSTACDKGSKKASKMGNNNSILHKRKCSVDKDSELCDAISLARSASESRFEAKRGLDDALSSQAASLTRADDRARKLEQQRSQLERVRRDIEEMRCEMEQLERETKEAREMGDGYARDACRRKRMTRNGNSGRPQCYATNSDTKRDSISCGPKNRGSSSFSRSFHPEDEFFSDKEHELTPRLSSERRGATSKKRHKDELRANTPPPYTATGIQGDGHQKHSHHTPRSDAISNTDSCLSKTSKKAAVSNPYAQTTAINPYSAGKGGRRSALERQHPHRSGRIQTERRFGTALDFLLGRH